MIDSSDKYATYATCVSLEMCRVANVERRCGRVRIRSRLAAQAKRNVEGRRGRTNSRIIRKEYFLAIRIEEVGRECDV